VKRRLVGAFLIAFGAWPLVHYGLVRGYGIDPWKLAGWAMYSVPGPMKTLRVTRIGDAGGFETLDSGLYAPEEQRAVDRFRERRRTLGRLESSDELAAALLELHPDWEGVVISVLTLALDREDASLRANVDHATHWRDGRDEPFAFPPAGKVARDSDSEP
jgi:hypothetical protein